MCFLKAYLYKPDKQGFIPLSPTVSVLPVAQGEEVENYNLAAVMESMGIYDTDLRDRGNTSQASSANETQRLLKILLSTLNKAMVQGAAAAPTDLPDQVEPSTENPLTGAPIEGRVEQARQDFFEVRCVCGRKEMKYGLVCDVTDHVVVCLGADCVQSDQPL